MPKVRFLHTSDWQLGMTRHFLSDGVQERYTQARFDAIRAIGRVAKEEECRFVIVCGDVFESNMVDRKTVSRAMEALKELAVPIFILPGNHDPLNAASVYRSSTFLERRPANLNVIESATPIKISEEVELVGAPWLSKKPVINPVEDMIKALAPSDGVSRICLAHGAVDILTPDQESADTIPLSFLEQALSDRKVHFIALGDRHSLTRVDSSGRIWYSGTPEATDFREVESGNVNIVEILDGEITSKGVRIGQWRFIEKDRVDINSDEDVENLRKLMDGIDNKDRTVFKLRLFGSLTLSLSGALQNNLIAAKDIFAALEVRDNNLTILPDDTDFANLGFSGFANETVQNLRKKISEGGGAGKTAREALMLMLRLARE